MQAARPATKKQGEKKQATNKQKSIRIRQITNIGPLLQLACEIYNKKTGHKVEYKCESAGVMMLRGVEVDLITKRVDTDKKTKIF